MKYPSRSLGKYYRLWFEIVPSQNCYSKFYICMTKSIENHNYSHKRCWYSQQVCDATIKF